MKEIKVLEGKVVAPEGMKVGIVASRFIDIKIILMTFFTVLIGCL